MPYSQCTLNELTIAAKSYFHSPLSLVYSTDHVSSSFFSYSSLDLMLLPGPESRPASRMYCSVVLTLVRIYWLPRNLLEGRQVIHVIAVRAVYN